MFEQSNKATQTQLLVSRLLPAKTGCGRAVIIHYFIISYDTMNTCTEHTVTSFKSGDAQTAQQMMQISNNERPSGGSGKERAETRN